MGDHANPRPVSGEIMTRASVLHKHPGRGMDVHDAEYVTLELSEPAHLPHRPSSLVGWSHAASGSIGMLRRKGGQSIPAGTIGRGPGFWALAILVSLGAFWASGGHALLGKSVPFARPTEPREPVGVERVRSRVESRNGRAVHFIEGEVPNHGPGIRSLSPLP
jgi:hypothetical protein